MLTEQGKKIVLTVLAAIIIIVLIVFLTKVLTNKKDAVYVSSEESTQEASTSEKTKSIENSTNTINTTKEQENVWTTNLANKENNNTNNSENKQTETNTQNNTNNAEKKEEKKETKPDSKNDAGVIYLTFDDGPSVNITPKILDILKKENIKATFFVINYSDKNEDLVKREVQEGHTIGIHGYSHEYSKIYKSKDTYLKNVYDLQAKIEKSTGVKTMYTRFPGGSSNTVSRKYCKGIMTDLTKELLAKGFKYYDWNVCAEDAGSAKSAKDVYNYTVKNLSKKRGNMVLMHDFSGAKKTLEALPDIIKYAKKNGYKFAAINDSTPMYAQHVNN